MSQTTTRYAIELEPGKWLSSDGRAVNHLHGARLYHGEPYSTLTICQDEWEHARIVPVKCEVQDE